MGQARSVISNIFNGFYSVYDFGCFDYQIYQKWDT